MTEVCLVRTVLGVLLRLRPLVLGSFAVCAALLAAPRTAQAEPWMAVREGYNCQQCHVNRTGGGGRTAFGRAYAQTSLAMVPVGDPLDGALSDKISIGMDVRAEMHGTLPQDACWRREGYDTWTCGPDPPDPETADPPVAEIVEAEVDHYHLHVPQANVQAEARVLPENLSIYFDYSLRGGVREALVIGHDLLGPAHMYAKAGLMFLPYGLRLQDDDAFIRQATGVNYSIKEPGVEIGFEPGPHFLSVAMTHGLHSRFPNKFSGLFAVVSHPVPRFSLRAGGSGQVFRIREDPASDDELITHWKAGGFLGVTLSRLTLLAEYDFVRDLPRPDEAEDPPSLDQHVVLAEANLLAWRGLNLKVGFHYWDPDVSVANDYRFRFHVEAEAFLIPFLHLRVFYRWNEDIPQRVDANADTLVIQIHGFY